MIIRKVITLTIEYDDEHELPPEEWNWNHLLGDTVQVIEVKYASIPRTVSIDHNIRFRAKT